MRSSDLSSDVCSSDLSRESDGNGFACAAGENYMVMPAQRCSNPGPSVLECGTCRPAIGMRRRGIGPAFKCAPPCFPSLQQYGRGGGMTAIKKIGREQGKVRVGTYVEFQVVAET